MRSFRGNMDMAPKNGSLLPKKEAGKSELDWKGLERDGNITFLLLFFFKKFKLFIKIGDYFQKIKVCEEGGWTKKKRNF